MGLLRGPMARSYRAGHAPPGFLSRSTCMCTWVGRRVVVQVSQTTRQTRRVSPKSRPLADRPARPIGSKSPSLLQSDKPMWTKQSSCMASHLWAGPTTCSRTRASTRSPETSRAGRLLPTMNLAGSSRTRASSAIRPHTSTTTTTGCFRAPTRWAGRPCSPTTAWGAWCPPRTRISTRRPLPTMSATTSRK
jgi:hypothetical protein